MKDNINEKEIRYFLIFIGNRNTGISDFQVRLSYVEIVGKVHTHTHTHIYIYIYIYIYISLFIFITAFVYQLVHFYSFEKCSYPTPSS